MPGFLPVASFPVASLSTSFTVSGSLPGTIRLNSILSVAFIATGGTAPYTYSATGLPTGLSINASTGVVSGTCATVGTFNWTVTATDSTSPTPRTANVSGTSQVVALPAFNYDFPNPRGKPWPSDVRTGWIWQTPSRIYAVGGYSITSKFIAYAVIIPQPYFIRRDYDLPLPIPPSRWSFIRRWESGPPFPLRETPYHPFGAQVFPDRFPPIQREGFVAPSLVQLLQTNRTIGAQSFPDRLPRLPRQYMDHQYQNGIADILGRPTGAQNFPDRMRRQPRQYMDHTFAIALRRGGEDMVVSFIWG